LAKQTSFTPLPLAIFKLFLEAKPPSSAALTHFRHLYFWFLGIFIYCMYGGIYQFCSKFEILLPKL